MDIRKYVTASGLTFEVGDFYGGDTDESISSIVSEYHNLTITTSSGFYNLTLKPGDYVIDTAGSGHIIKSKYDKQDE